MILSSSVLSLVSPSFRARSFRLPYLCFVPPLSRVILFADIYVVRRHEANDLQNVHVDYDDEDYFRFRRVEKQLVN